MQRTLWALAPSLVLVWNVGLADSPKASNGPAFTDQAKAILVNRDHPDFSIVLKSNPTTGYRWVLRHYNRHLLRLRGEKFAAPSTKTVGSPGYVTFYFHARKSAFLASQKTKIMLEYVRPWEANATDVQRATFSVVTSY